MESGLIDKFGNVINCEYYEIEKYCIKIINDFCKESNENKKKFFEFAKDYTYFSPYFDFVIGVLNYSLLNPFFINKNILCGNSENHSYLMKFYSSIIGDYVIDDYNKEIMGFSSDDDLKIKPFNQITNFYNSFITGDLTELVPNVKGHRELAKQILNLTMIKDKELCQEILSIDFQNSDLAEVLMWYLPLLRFDDYLYKKDSFSLIYRSDNISSKQENLIRKLEKLKCQKFIGDQATLSIHKTYDWSFKFYNYERLL